MSTLNLENIKHPDSASNNISVDSSGNVGIGTASPDQTLHVHKGSAGAATSQPLSVLTLENSTTAVLQFLTPSTSSGQVRFGDPSDNGAGYIDYSHSSNALTFGVNGPERMRIDSAGRVTMPYQPMVHVAKNNGAFTASSGIWIGNRNDVNVGGHYNNSTGVFTAPVTGLYYFSFFILAQANHNFDLGIRKNGSQYSESDFRCNNGAVNHNFTLSGSVLMNLAQNDTADLYVTSNPGGTIYGNGLNGIQIMLVG